MGTEDRTEGEVLCRDEFLAVPVNLLSLPPTPQVLPPTQALQGPYPKPPKPSTPSPPKHCGILLSKQQKYTGEKEKKRIRIIAPIVQMCDCTGKGEIEPGLRPIGSQVERGVVSNGKPAGSAYTLSAPLQPCVINSLPLWSELILFQDWDSKCTGQ
ncbi:hypothetical protein MATL_G00259960 [Megalops atlanticus]|uniref:Uncharacterized protein n=1 Tax=Megalops atlanticus TaxID=7932 RepID=A0A9D3P8S2_MEGAT|nr:hypothetical protein MATL_G00259960 [Megalops atlanticus]